MPRKMPSIIAAALITIAAAPVFASETYVPPPEEQKGARVTSQSVFATKCAKCHELARPEKAQKSPADWKATVDRMQGKDPKWISAADNDRICRFLSGRDLAKAKCNKCHPDSRADVNKTDLQWQTTLDRMQSKDPKWISNDEKALIKFYLTDIFLLELD